VARSGVLAVVGILLGLGVVAVRAEDPQEQKADVEKEARPVFEEHVTVVGRPIVEATKIDDYANPVTTVTEGQMRDLNAQDIDSALRRVPGVVISRYNPVGNYGGGDGGGLFIRGMGSGRPGAEISTMVDGIPKFVGVWTHPLLDTLSIDLAREIDVYRGAQPVLLGNMAFGAVNLVPKRRMEPGHGGGVSVAGGSFGTLLGRLDYGGREERFDYYVSASHRQSDGSRMDADGRVDALFGRVGAKIADGWDLSVMFDGSDAWADDPRAEGAPPIPLTERFAIRDNFAMADVSHVLGRWSGSAKIYSDRGAIDWRQWDPDASEPFSTLTDYDNYGIRVREKLAVTSRGEVVFGLDHDLYGGSAREERPAGEVPQGDYRFRNTAPYVAASRTFGSNVQVVPSAGLRYNQSRDFGSDWGGQAGVVVRGKWGQAYARYAHAFNLPGVWTAVFYDSFYGRTGQWRDLRAETLDQIEAGYSRTLGSWGAVEIALFDNRGANALRFVPPPPPPPLFANIGEYRTTGAEATLSFRPHRTLDLLLGGTFTNSDPEDLPFSPRWTTVGGATWAPTTKWRLSLDAQWLGDRWVSDPRFPGGAGRVDGFFLLNGRAAWKVGAGEVFLAAENLTDAGYEYRPGYPMPGINAMAGLNWNF